MDKIVDHLFRYEYGKMVSSLTRLFGSQHIELVEDVVQDTFHTATIHWRKNGVPDVPEAWLRTVARNKSIDLLRKIQSRNNVEQKYLSGTSTIAIQEIFSDEEISDNQLRLIFMICHPSLKLQDQIIFALKTFSGFSRKEISTALLKSEENIKKSLTRAKKNVIKNDIKFEVPDQNEFLKRLENVHLVLYLLFNEGFHSSNKKELVRRDLVAEAIRLNGLLIESFDHSNSKALMALMCFHAARLNAKISDKNEMIKLKHQDRSKWNFELIKSGHKYMEEATMTDNYSRFHWEAAIAGEYVQSSSFETTNWKNLEIYYRNLLLLIPSAINSLNLCVILLQGGKLMESKKLFEDINAEEMEGRIYLYFSVGAEIRNKLGDLVGAKELLIEALNQVENDLEKNLILDKLSMFDNKN